MTTSTLPVGSIRIDACLPAARAVGQRAEHPARGQPAHLGEGGDADAELDRVVRARAARCCSRAQLVVAEQLQGLGRRGLVVARVVLQPGHRGERELLVLDPVLLAQLQRVHAQLGGQLVHDPLDGERGLRPAGAAVGVGGHLGGEHARAVEPVGRELVDRGYMNAPRIGMPGVDQPQVGAHVGEQVDVQRRGRCRRGRRRSSMSWIWSRPWWADEQRLAAGLGPLDRLAQPWPTRRGRGPPRA